MTVIKYSDDVLGWKRKPGPVRVWRVVDGLKKTVDGKTLRFSIQEVPEDRYNDVLDHLCTSFIRDEPLCKHNKVVDKPEEISDFFQLWGLAFGQGAIVGAFLVEDDNPKPKLVGVNMTLVHTETSDKAWEAAVKLTGVISKKIVGFMSELDKVANVKERYKVDKYLTAYGLSVDPQYRGQGLGLQLLEARNDMAAAYDLKATSTSFTAVPAQKVAERAGFELLVEQDYADLKNEDGTEMFPGMPHKSVKLMGKTLT